MKSAAHLSMRGAEAKHGLTTEVLHTAGGWEPASLCRNDLDFGVLPGAALYCLLLVRCSGSGDRLSQLTRRLDVLMKSVKHQSKMKKAREGYSRA
jgi:hypothetical protein